MTVICCFIRLLSIDCVPAGLDEGDPFDLDWFARYSFLSYYIPILGAPTSSKSFQTFVLSYAKKFNECRYTGLVA